MTVPIQLMQYLLVSVRIYIIYCYRVFSPARGWVLVGARGKRVGLVEADAGYVGSFDGVGVVVVLFGEGEGEVLDAVGDPQFFEELDEVAEVLDEVVIAFVGLDVAQEEDVIGEIEHSSGLSQNDYCGGECRVVRG